MLVTSNDVGMERHAEREMYEIDFLSAIWNVKKQLEQKRQPFDLLCHMTTTAAAVELSSSFLQFQLFLFRGKMGRKKKQQPQLDLLRVAAQPHAPLLLVFMLFVCIFHSFPFFFSLLVTLFCLFFQEEACESLKFLSSYTRRPSSS